MANFEIKRVNYPEIVLNTLLDTKVTSESLLDSEVFYLSGGYFENKSFRFSDISNLRMINIDFSEHNIHHSFAVGSVFVNCDFTKSIAHNCDFRKCTFIKCEFSKANFRDCKFNDAVFVDINVDQADFTYSEMSNVSNVKTKY